METSGGRWEMHEDQHSQSRIHGGIDEPFRVCTCESRVKPGCNGDKAMYVEHRSCNNQWWSHPFSASREEVVIGLEEDLVESTVEVGENWMGSVSDYPYCRND